MILAGLIGKDRAHQMSKATRLGAAIAPRGRPRRLDGVRYSATLGTPGHLRRSVTFSA